MNKVASSAMKGVDVLIYVIEGFNWTEEDQELMNQIPEGYETSILVINKIDKIKKILSINCPVFIFQFVRSNQ